MGRVSSRAFNPKTIPLEVAEKIKNIDLSVFTRLERFHIDRFLFCYYIGMANVDACYLTWDCIDKNGILKYERIKYPKIAILPFVPKARVISKKYSDKCFKNYVLPVFSVFSHKHITEYQKLIRMKGVRESVNPSIF